MAEQLKEKLEEKGMECCHCHQKATPRSEKEKKQLINYILKYRMNILKNKKAPKRDKIAIILLGVSYKLYRTCWLEYLRLVKGME